MGVKSSEHSLLDSLYRILHCVGEVDVETLCKEEWLHEVRFCTQDGQEWVVEVKKFKKFRQPTGEKDE